MAIGPRLDLRQSQTLVMTPQLRQAIKLLQFSNLEVTAFIEEELERNPLLERDERPDLPAPPSAGAGPGAEPPARGDPADTAERARSETLPDRPRDPLDADSPNSYDPAARRRRRDARRRRHDFDADERGIEEFAATPPTLREHLGEQLRLSFPDPVDRLIGAHLIALLCPAGRLTAEPAAIADALGVRARAGRGGARAHDALRSGRAVRPRPRASASRAQLAERNRLDPAMQALLDNLDLLARRDLRRLMAVCGVDAEDLAEMIAEIRGLDPKPGAGFDDGAAQPVIPDVLMRPAPTAAGCWSSTRRPCRACW